MPVGETKIVRYNGPWRGLNENPGECGPGQFEDAWNADFDGDVIRTRGGREVFGSPILVSPCRVVVDTPVPGVYAEVRPELVSDGDPETGFTIAPLAGTSGNIYISFPRRVSDCRITLERTGAAASYLNVFCCTAATPGLVTYELVSSTDGTSGFSGSGTIAFTAPTPWPYVSSNYSGEGYIVQIEIRAPNPAGSYFVSQISGALAASTEKNGVYSYTGRNGRRNLVVGCDDAGDGSAALCITSQAGGGGSAVFDGAANGRGLSGPGARWRFGTIGGSLLACNGYTLRYSDPANQYLLKAFKHQKTSSSDVYQQPPQSARYLAVYNGAIAVVEPGAPNSVRVSRPIGPSGSLSEESNATAPFGGANLWERDARFYCSDPSGGEITGITAFGDGLAIFTPRTMRVWRGTADDPNGGSMQEVSSSIGCIAPDSISQTDNAIFFLGPDGPCVFDGSSIKQIGDAVAPTLQALNRSALCESCGTVYAKRNQYRLHVPLGNSKKNNIVLVYNYKKDAWSKYGQPQWAPAGSTYQDYQVKFVSREMDPEAGEQIWECDYDGNIWLADSGEDDNGKRIFTFLAGDRIKFEDQGVVTARSAKLKIKSFGNNNSELKVDLLREGEDWKKAVSGLSKTVSQYLYDSGSVTAAMQKYGTATVGTDLWRSRRFITKTVSFGETGTDFQLALYSGLPVCLKGIEFRFILRGCER